MWQGILGHDEIVDRFRRAVQRNRLASTYLFVGPAGIGKKRFALALARALLCQTSRADPLEPCGRCESCRLLAAGSHPDVDVVGLPRDKSTLPLELFIGDQQHRNQEGLCHRIALRPYLSGRKVAIIDDADYFSQESANCLLKTLEEPPPRSLMILIGTTPSKQLPTIRSRSQVVRFEPLAAEVLAEVLRSSGDAADADTINRLATYGAGSLQKIHEISDPALWQFRAQLLHDLSSAQTNPVRLAKAVQTFVDEAGKETSERRERLRAIVGFAAEFYRAWMRSDAGSDFVGDELVQVSLSKAQKILAHRAPIESLDASLRAVEHVDRNANLGLVVQRWCEEIVGRRVSN